MSKPRGLDVDAFGHLIVYDAEKKSLNFFKQEGEFLKGIETTRSTAHGLLLSTQALDCHCLSWLIRSKKASYSFGNVRNEQLPFCLLKSLQLIVRHKTDLALLWFLFQRESQN